MKEHRAISIEFITMGFMVLLHTGRSSFRINSIRPGFLAGNSVFWRETPSVNIVSIASYKMNHNAAIRKQMWFIFLIAIRGFKMILSRRL